MLRMRLLSAASLTVLLLAYPASANPGASSEPSRFRLSYDTYAAGLEVMQMTAFFGLGPWNYQIDIDYHTTGLVGFLYRGRQVNKVRGTWQDDHAVPIQFAGEGTWRGQQRRTVIDYQHGEPEVRELVPPQQSEREPVPRELQLHTMDTLSALAELIRRVERNQSCETRVHTYDGRRVLEVSARTGGNETLEPTSRSTFSGPALRCDFEGHELAGFLLGDNDPEHRRPLHGSAWLAALRPEGPVLPVRIAFQTRWFGPATMYLTAATPVGMSGTVGN
jgi:Protein of unknown function (DUF3108)